MSLRDQAAAAGFTLAPLCACAAADGTHVHTDPMPTPIPRPVKDPAGRVLWYQEVAPVLVDGEIRILTVGDLVP